MFIPSLIPLLDCDSGIKGFMRDQISQSSIRHLDCFITWPHWCQTARVCLCVSHANLCVHVCIPNVFVCQTEGLVDFSLLLVSVNLASNNGKSEKRFVHTHTRTYCEGRVKMQGSPCGRVLIPLCQFRQTHSTTAAKLHSLLCVCVCVCLYVLICVYLFIFKTHP